MLRTHTLFKRFIISSPLVRWEGNFLFNYEDNYSKNYDQLDAKIFISWGEYEDTSILQRFLRQITSRNYKGLEIATSMIHNTGHAGNKPEGYTRGMRALYCRPILSLTLEKLQKYTGTYKCEEDKFIIALDQTGLIFHRTELDAGSKIIAHEENLFYLIGTYMFFYFHFENENITHVNVELFAKALTFYKTL